MVAKCFKGWIDRLLPPPPSCPVMVAPAETDLGHLEDGDDDDDDDDDDDGDQDDEVNQDQCNGIENFISCPLLKRCKPF